MAFLWLPAAVRDPHGRSLTFTETTDPKGCLHTTETSGWPDYQGWTVHPHLTVRPIPGKGVQVRQHIPFDRAGFALRNLSGGVETNRDYVFQVELVGTCDRGGPSHKAGAYLWPDADDAVLRDLAEKVIVPMSEGLGIPLRALPFQAYDASYGTRGGTNRVRLSGPDFDRYTGWLGHEHVPENVHGDPGAFPWPRMMELLEGDVPLTSDDAKKVFATDDTVTNPTRTADANPATSAGTALGRIWADTETLKDDVDGLKAAVSRIPTTLPPLSSADQDTIAAKVAAKLPKPPTAAEVAAELIRQLKG